MNQTRKHQQYFSKRIISVVLIAIVQAIGITHSFSQERKPPPLPEDKWVNTNFNLAFPANLSTEQPFDPSIHENLTPMGEICSNQLNAAIYRQDVLHGLESKAHFDNCAFDETLDYISSLISESDGHFSSISIDHPMTNNIPDQLQDGMLSLGQALHAIQDFYAHTNYIELLQNLDSKTLKESDIPIIEMWLNKGKKDIHKLMSQGLVSGKVWWTFPQSCSLSTLTHSKLAKDSPTTPAGLAHSIWKKSFSSEYKTNYAVAYSLAHRATRKFIFWSGNEWPVIKKYCGKTLKYIIQKDRRIIN